MASTYVNNLRLEEIGTGEQSGTWGDTTNTNLELIGQATAWGTRAIANASTDNITIADGAADADRCLGLKLTGGGQACTVTLLPNTSSKTWFMYNATSYTLTFTCGSGANVAIPAGQTKVIATDGLGSGGVVHDLLTEVNFAGDVFVTNTLNVAGDTAAGDNAAIGYTAAEGLILTGQGSTNDVTIKNDADADVIEIPTGTTNVTVAGNLGVGGTVTGTGTSVFASLDISGDIDVDGTTNLDVTNIVGDLTVTADTVTFTSANTNDPALKLINTTNDTDGAEFQIRKDKGAAGADGDIVGLISFIGDDAAQQQMIFAKMTVSIATAADGNEGGKLAIGLATHDAEFQDGLVLQDGNAEDEIDVTIGSGTSSITTFSGHANVSSNLTVTGTVLNLPTVNSFITGAGHNVVQVDATKTYLYGGTGGVQFRTADNASGLIDIANNGVTTFNKKIIVSAADGVADADYVASFTNSEATSGRNFGLSVAGGTSSSDFALNVVNGAANTALLRVDGVGNTSINGTIKSVGGGLIASDGTSDTLVISGSNALNTGGNITLEGNAASDASQIKFKNGSTQVMKVAGGKILVGTDVANGETSNTIPVRAGIFSTQTDSTTIASINTATALMTFGSNEGNFLVSARGSGTGDIRDNTTGIVHINNSATSYTALVAGSHVVLSMDGLVLKCSQAIFNGASITWNVIRIA